MAAGLYKTSIRTVAFLILAFSFLVLVNSALVGSAGKSAIQEAGTPGGSSPAADGREPTGSAVNEGDITVVTTQGFYTGERPGDRQTAMIVAFDATGDRVYVNRSHGAYFDVDPVRGTEATVEYVAAERTGSRGCSLDQCSLNFVERLNLSTGETTRIYGAYTNQWDTGRWHDVDRLNQTHLVIADIVRDRVYMVNTETNETTWQWNADTVYDITDGGGSGDWTHINDVEVLDDGRIMVSLRNLDQILFIEPGEGIQKEWTLGEENDHSVLYEQHNPDYIPVDRGGPAVVLTDSENGRVIEYQREGGEWKVAWTWRDGRLQWPRDADRLPSGHTLITDSHGDRVVEVDENGSVVWRVDIEMGYDAERLGTGDESAGGHAAGSRTGAAPPATHQKGESNALVLQLKDPLPDKPVNGLLFVSPGWVHFADLVVLFVALFTVLTWGSIEWYWKRTLTR